MKPQIILCFLIFAALIVVIGTSSFSTTQDHSKEDLEERTSTTAASPIKKKGSKPDIKIASQFRTQIRRRSIQQDQSKGATGTLPFSTNQDYFKEEQLKKEHKSTTPSFTSRLVADSFLHVFMTIMVVNMKFNLSLICT